MPPKTPKIKQLLEKIVKEKASGPAPTFSALHLLRAVELVAEKSVGRAKLSEELKIGEGATRTIITRLKEAGLISTSKAGCSLTMKGRKLWEEYKKVIVKEVEIENCELMNAKHNVAALIKNCGHKVKTGIEQRDAAVKIGAKGAVTIVFRNGRLIIPSVSDDFLRDYPNAAEQIANLMQPKENDVIIISGADTLDLARNGVAAAAWTLLDNR
ncbi:MAG: DUF4443 domain-containing protein [Candidatus Bathyarchaeia archaeon]